MILISTQCFPPSVGGIQAVMGGLAKSATECGLPVTVLADSSWGWQAHDAAAEFSVVRYGGIKPLRRLMKARGVGRAIATGAPSFLFCDSWKSVERVETGCMPTLVFAWGMEFPPNPGALKKARIAAAFSKASAVIAASRYTAELARPYVPLGTPLQVINPAIAPLEDAGEAAAELRDQHGSPVLVGLARLEPRKGFDRVIEALPQLAERHPGITFLIGGDGSDKARLEALARRQGVASRVHFLGTVAGRRKSALLAAADLFVMPTRRVGSSVEGFGIVYAEAAWFGVPAIASVEGGAGDIVEDGVTGRLIDGSTPLTRVLLDLLADLDRLKSMGATARARVRSSGTWEHVFARLMELAKSTSMRRCSPPELCVRCRQSLA
jgi:phosphatidylinositol alpha-1,6-mannosyltransferase